jgi:hypothetical protein
MRNLRLVVLGALLVIVCEAAVGLRAQSTAPPLTAADFQQAAPRGFGDRNNSWPQSMAWWHEHLYVGTSRAAACSSLFAIWDAVLHLTNQTFADFWFPYPPLDPDLSCPADGADLALQAEIWQWSPLTDTWLRVFQSPDTLVNPGPGPPDPPPPGKMLPYEIGFRGMTGFTEPDGTEALYAFGVNSTLMWDRNQLPPPRILRSTDGVNFTPLPQTAATFLHDLPFNPDHSSFRSPESFNGKLFVLSGPVFGQGSLIASADPAKGDNAWFLAAPKELVFYEMATFNGWLYLGTFSPLSGYSVVKTRAEGAPPYQFVTVVPPGAYLTGFPSRSVVSMHEYAGRLYVGTATIPEVIRINPDDTWDLVVGQPRQVPLPSGGTEWKYPLSNLNGGFGHTLNDHAWQMASVSGNLYIGTYNASTGLRLDPVSGPLLRHNMGAHLYRTKEGWYFTAVTTNGFSSPDDPYGGLFDYGIRSITPTPYGTFFGLTNDHYGLSIFEANARESSRPAPPERLDAEPTAGGSALLSWRAVPGATSYQVWRADVNPIQVRDDINVEAWQIVFRLNSPCDWEILPGVHICNKIPDKYVGPYSQIAATQNTSFVDATAAPGKTYMYYVAAGTPTGPLSDQSNLVTFPVLTPAMTFAEMLRQENTWTQRQRFMSASLRNELILTTLVAYIQAMRCQLGPAMTTLNAQPASRYLLDPEAADLEVITSKLTRRLALFQQAPQNVVTTEFCSRP